MLKVKLEVKETTDQPTRSRPLRCSASSSGLLTVPVGEIPSPKAKHSPITPNPTPAKNYNNRRNSIPPVNSSDPLSRRPSYFRLNSDKAVPRRLPPLNVVSSAHVTIRINDSQQGTSHIHRFLPSLNISPHSVSPQQASSGTGSSISSTNSSPESIDSKIPSAVCCMLQTTTNAFSFRSPVIAGSTKATSNPPGILNKPKQVNTLDASLNQRGTPTLNGPS